MQPPVFKPRDRLRCGKARTVEVKQERNRELGTGAEPVGEGARAGMRIARMTAQMSMTISASGRFFVSLESTFLIKTREADFVPIR